MSFILALKKKFLTMLSDLISTQYRLHLSLVTKTVGWVGYYILENQVPVESSLLRWQYLLSEVGLLESVYGRLYLHHWLVWNVLRNYHILISQKNKTIVIAQPCLLYQTSTSEFYSGLWLMDKIRLSCQQASNFVGILTLLDRKCPVT